MSLKARDIEELFRRFGEQEGMRRTVLLLSETVIAQEQALLEVANTVDTLGRIVNDFTTVQHAMTSQLEMVKKKMGHDIDDEGFRSEPITELGKGG